MTAEALEPFRRAPEQRTLLPHLQSPTGDAYEINLEVWLNGFRISHTNFANMYWTFSQMVAHHTSNGCNLRPGDLIGSGTVSGPLKENRGCLLELTWKGTEPLRLPNGEVRRFLEDGDEVVLKGWCDAPGYRRIGWRVPGWWVSVCYTACLHACNFWYGFYLRFLSSPMNCSLRTSIP